MSQESPDFRRTIRRALQSAPAVWTPDCPEPETLLAWVEQGSNHPQAAALLDHLFGCAYCRGERAALRELRALAQRPAPTRVRGTARIKVWADELIHAGFTAPVALVGRTLDALSRLAAPGALALTRSTSAPSGLRPKYTAVRTPHPVLRWSPAGAAVQEYTVVITRHMGRKAPHIVWQGSAGRECRMALLEDDGLEPGGIYLWQVTARTGDQEAVSSPAPFAVMTLQTRRQLEALERHTEEATVDRIGLCEAYGLYDEALQQVEVLGALRPDEPAVPAIRTRLLQQMAG